MKFGKARNSLRWSTDLNPNDFCSETWNRSNNLMGFYNLWHSAFPDFHQKFWKTSLSTLYVDMTGQDWS